MCAIVGLIASFFGVKRMKKSTYKSVEDRGCGCLGNHGKGRKEGK